MHDLAEGEEEKLICMDECTFCGFSRGSENKGWNKKIYTSKESEHVQFFKFRDI